MDISRVGVVGAGQMGAGIAEVCARAGLDVVLWDVDDEALGRGREALFSSLEKAVTRGKIDPSLRDEALGRVSATTDFEAFGERQLVVEAVIEDVEVKSRVFARLDRAAPGAVLASNTSSIPIITLANATTRPGDVIGIHFFNPAPVMRLVEIIPSVVTSGPALELAVGFVEAIGKDAVRAKDRAGFIVNNLLTTLMLEATRMYESEFASAADIDKAMTLGANHPMGPLALADLIGLDTVLAVAERIYEELRDPKYAAPPVLRRMVEAGMLGRKTGRGFYQY